MKCDMCRKKIPYAEMFDTELSVWYYVCKDCFSLYENKNKNRYGFFILPRLEKICVYLGLTSLKWKIQEWWWHR